MPGRQLRSWSCAAAAACSQESVDGVSEDVPARQSPQNPPQIKNSISPAIRTWRAAVMHNVAKAGSMLICGLYRILRFRQLLSVPAIRSSGNGWASAAVLPWATGLLKAQQASRRKEFAPAAAVQHPLGIRRARGRSRSAAPRRRAPGAGRWSRRSTCSRCSRIDDDRTGLVMAQARQAQPDPGAIGGCEFHLRRDQPQNLRMQLQTQYPGLPQLAK